MEVERDQHKPPLSLQNNKIPSSQNFPVVDLSNTNGELVARKVAKASEEWGIFQVVNHGIPTELIRRLHKVDTQFFELPESKKEAVAKPANSKEIQGYEMDDVQGRRSHIFHNLYPSSSVNYAFWPKNPPEYREVTEEFAKHAKQLAEEILGLLSEGAGYLMKINYYRPCPEPDWVMGIKAHTDFNGLTLLIPNEIFGLQVFKEDRWLDVDYIYPAVIIIIGDQIMKMSNGRYNNVLHRALMDKKKTRMSSVVHIKPPYDMVVSHFPNSPAAIILPSSSL
ncbi:unnamed protein product [Arabidopsis thaliana]|uniref:Probable flavonol synthase 4 n=2 Tax=Arabidopsis thaliana TaxID=3702 RepID=FLS4_ARATH|nr:flavonol synthase 4 [Arabidopsis thaliana]F4KAS1.1 RecName: Full=Probable flavonol synthase 4 [Arabidopsis thaliana]AED97773.1 flavonol synthase 4 [Arabidopsis thaliana]VYS71295.1 unnamed protein product [Arabidopsis thaliana]|eukprot:NP_680463.1 flavonol synthase 4 [Arabidopsis thaliana]